MVRLRGVSGFGLSLLCSACAPHERPQEPSTLCAAGMALIDSEPGALAVGRFCMDTTEVTTASYGACVQAGVCAPAIVGNGEGCNLTRADRGDHPINCTSWSQAQAFCGWVGKRLPDDDEWIWAARARAPADPYPWGSAPVDATRACWDRTAVGTCPVGSTPAGASRSGVLDLVGNVAEWTRGASEGPNGRGRLRGGSWQDSVYTQPIDERFADSARDEPTEAATLASGLRCVTAPLTPVQEVDDSTWVPHRPWPPDGGSPVLAATPGRLAPTRPLANFTVLRGPAEVSEQHWPVGGGYVALDGATAAMLGLAAPIDRRALPASLGKFELLRALGDRRVVMAWSAWNDRKYVAVEPDDAAKIRWQVSLGTRTYTEMVAPRTLVVQSYGQDVDSLVAFALDSGREVWRLPGGPDAPFTRIRWLWLDGERGLLLGDRGLAAFDTVSGAVVWMGVGVADGCGVARGPGRLVVEDPAQGHRVLDPDSGATLRRIKGETGACLWDLGSWDGGTAGAVIEGDLLFAFDRPDRLLASLRAFDLETGGERWRRAGLGVERLLADHDAVYVQRAPGVVTALDAATGETRAEVSIGSQYSLTIEQVGGAAGPVLIVEDHQAGPWVLGRAERPAVPESWVIRGRLVPTGVPRKRVAGVPVLVGEHKVRTDATGRFEARGRAVGALGVALGTARGPELVGGSRVRFEPSVVVLTGQRTYDVGDIELRAWELY